MTKHKTIDYKHSAVKYSLYFNSSISQDTIISLTPFSLHNFIFNASFL